MREQKQRKGVRVRKNQRAMRVEARMRVEALEDRRLMAGGVSSLLFDFGTPTSPVAANAFGISSQTYSPSLGYGWKSLPSGYVDRGTANPLSRDLNYGVDSTFEFDLPNGTYTVTPTLGDAMGSSRVSIWANGTPVVSRLTTKSGQFSQPSFQVTVTNSQLALRFTNGNANAYNFKLDGLQIDRPTFASPGPNLSVNEGDQVTFAGQAFAWPNPTYTWDFGDGSGAGGTLTPQHVYRDNGTYTVTLTATDGFGNSARAISTATINNAAPTASITGAPTSSPEGTLIALGSSVTDPSPVDTAAGFTDSWSVTKNGNPFASGTAGSFSFTPDDNGTYVVSLNATDKDGGVSAPATSTITVSNVAPTANAGGPYTAIAGQSVTFNGSATDPSSVDTAAGFTYAWDFGDSSTGTGASASHTYATTGTYTATLTVTDQDGGAGTAQATATVSSTASAPPSMLLQNYDGPTIPTNRAGDYYPTYYNGSLGGVFSENIDPSDAVSGSSLKMSVSSGQFYAQWNPWDTIWRGFAREYSADPTHWQFNTYNRMTFWIKRPTSTSALLTTGQQNVEFGTYVKQVTNEDLYSDETGGNHYYHLLNLSNNGLWTHVILNMHPDHYRGELGAEDPGVRTYPTASPYGADPPNTYNYFDTFTRFYINEPYSIPSSYPAEYKIDDIEFYQEQTPENDLQVYSLTANYNPANNELIVTWNHDKDDITMDQEVRYSFSDVHQIGWNAATPAPNGVIVPPGGPGYNSMSYDSTALPLPGQSVVYIAIKPQNSDLFSQIAVPLTSNLNLGPAAPAPNSTPTAQTTTLCVQTSPAGGMSNLSAQATTPSDTTSPAGANNTLAFGVGGATANTPVVIVVSVPSSGFGSRIGTDQGGGMTFGLPDIAHLSKRDRGRGFGKLA